VLNSFRRRELRHLTEPVPEAIFSTIGRENTIKGLGQDVREPTFGPPTDWPPGRRDTPLPR